MEPVWRYFAFGFGIRSELPIPELTDCFDDTGQPVHIRWRSLSADLPGAHYRNGVLQVADDEIQIAIPDVARFRLRAGQEVVVHPLSGASDRDVRAYLLGAALGLLCHQRDLLPLHANAIIAGQHSVAIAGNSGMGKSTLAAHFHDRGYGLLSDDICAVSFPEKGAPLAWSGIPRLRLWKDSAEAFGRDTQTLDPITSRYQKFDWPLSVPTHWQGLPLKGVYILTDAKRCRSDEIFRVDGVEAVAAIMEQTFRREFISFVGGAERRFAWTLALLANVPVFRVPWRHDFGILAAEAAKLESHIVGESTAANMIS